MRLLFYLAIATFMSGCWTWSSEADETTAQSSQKTKVPPKGSKSKTKSKAKAPPQGKGKAKAKSPQPAKPPPEYGAEGEIKGVLVLTPEDLEEGKKRTKAELAISWKGSDGVEGGEDKILLGHAPGTCTSTEPTPFTENETEITPLWSAQCTHDKATAQVVLYQAGNLLLLKRSVLGAEDKPGPWKPVKKVRFAKGAKLVP